MRKVAMIMGVLMVGSAFGFSPFDFDHETGGSSSSSTSERTWTTSGGGGGGGGSYLDGPPQTGQSEQTGDNYPWLLEQERARNGYDSKKGTYYPWLLEQERVRAGGGNVNND